MNARNLLAPLFLLSLLVPVASANAAVLALGPHGNSSKQLTSTVIDRTTGSVYLGWSSFDGADDRAGYRSVDSTGSASAFRAASASGASVAGAAIAVGPDGTVHEAWKNGTDLEYRTVKPDGTLGPVRVLSQGSGGFVPNSDVQVHVDANGAAHVVWIEVTTSAQLFHVRIAADGTVGTADPITDGTSTVGAFDSALGSDGTLRIAWDNATVLEYTTITAAGVIAPTIQPDPAEDVDGERVLVDSTGRARLVYHAINGGEAWLKHVDVSPAAVVGAPQVLSPPASHGINSYDADLTSTGEVLIAWDDNDQVAAEYQMRFVRLAFDGTPGTTMAVDPVDTNVHDVRIAATPSGGASFVATRLTGPIYRVYYIPISSDDVVGASTVLSGNTDTSSFSDVAVDPQGRAWVTWAEDSIGQRLWVVGSLPFASTSSLDFGSRDQGTGASAARTVTITNRSLASLDAQLGTAVLSGSGASSFAISGTTCASTLAPGASCTVSVTFAPAAAGALAATLTIPQASPGRAMTVSLAGTGTTAPTVDESVTCPSGNSTGVRCFLINDSIRTAWGCAPGDENGYLILGTAAADTIRGTGRGDIVLAGAGGDTVRSGAGNDAIWGAGGMDGIYAEAGDDCVNAGALADQVWGGAGADVIHGNSGGDTIRGGTGNDRVYGDDNRDTLYGNAGDDQLFGGRHPDKLYGNAGNDVLKGGAGDDPVLDGGTGRNTITA